MVEANRQIPFSQAEMERLRDHARGLGTSYRELIRFCVLQGLDELDAIVREERQANAAYEAHRRAAVYTPTPTAVESEP